MGYSSGQSSHEVVHPDRAAGGKSWRTRSWMRVFENPIDWRVGETYKVIVEPWVRVWITGFVACETIMFDPI